MGSIVFKDLNKEYLEWARELHNDPSVLSMLTDNNFVSKEKQLSWFCSLQESESSRRLVVFLDGVAVGIVRLDNIDSYNKSMCIGLDIHKDFRGKKLATGVYVKLLYWCFEIMEYNRVWLMVADFNIVAKNLYTKLGFVYEGRQREALYREGAYLDYLLMSILRKEYYCDTFI